MGPGTQDLFLRDPPFMGTTYTGFVPKGSTLHGHGTQDLFQMDSSIVSTSRGLNAASSRWKRGVPQSVTVALYYIDTL